jgi:hypothetical protein
MPNPGPDGAAPGADGGTDAGGKLSTTISGTVQKGPYVLGSTIIVQELDATLAATGRTFQTTTNDSQGDFNVPVNVTSPYVELLASGYYFDELTNQRSAETLDLHALADLRSGATVNVNLLTSMSDPLERALVGQGLTFAQAQSQAESSVLATLNFTALGTSFTNVGLTGMSTASGEALAASLIVEQYAASFGGIEPARLAQLLFDIGAPATTDGGATGIPTLAGLHAALCTTEQSIPAATVRANLTAYYASVSPPVTVPPFEQFLCGCGLVCQAACVNPMTDVNNCGACGKVCPVGGSCVGANCVCPTGDTVCSNTCVNEQTDSNNCGACGSPCPTGGTCQSAKCVCAAGATLCSGACVNVLTDAQNCGMCGKPCAASTPVCVQGTCTNTVRYGYTTPLTGIANNLGNYIFGMSVTVPAAIRVTALGCITNATGGMFVMGLYTNNGGVPGTLLASTAPETATNGVQEFPVTPVAIAAGTYWVTASAGPGGVNHWDYAAMNSDWAAVYTYTGTMPATAPAGQVYPNDTLDFYLVGGP